MILLTNVCCKSSSSLNRVELFGSGQFIPDDSYPSTYKGANERMCVTDPKTNTEKFVSSPTPVSSYQEHLDQSRLSSAKADTLEVFLVAIKDDASIDSYCSYCDAVSRRECHDVAVTVCADVQERKCQVYREPVHEIVSRQQCSSPSSGLFPKFLTNMLRCQGDQAGVSLNPERPRDLFDDIKIRIVSQASSATIPSKWRNVNERKCSDQQMPRTTYDTVKRILFSIQSFFKQFIKVKRVELNVRTDTAIGAEVDILSNVKKVEVRCDKLASLM